MSSLFVVQGSDFCVLLSDTLFAKPYDNGNEFTGQVHKLFHLYPHLYAGAVGSFQVYKGALDRFAAYLQTEYPPERTADLPGIAELAAILAGYARAAYQAWAERPGASAEAGGIAPTTIALVSAGRLLYPATVERGFQTAITCLESAGDFQPHPTSGIMIAYDGPLSGLALSVWEAALVRDLRYQGSLVQLQILVAIHALCSRLSAWIGPEYDALIVGPLQHQVMHGTLQKLPAPYIW